MTDSLYTVPPPCLLAEQRCPEDHILIILILSAPLHQYILRLLGGKSIYMKWVVYSSHQKEGMPGPSEGTHNSIADWPGGHHQDELRMVLPEEVHVGGGALLTDESTLEPLSLTMVSSANVEDPGEGPDVPVGCSDPQYISVQ